MLNGSLTVPENTKSNKTHAGRTHLNTAIRYPLPGMIAYIRSLNHGKRWKYKTYLYSGVPHYKLGKKERKKVARISKFKDPILMLNHLDIQIEETLPKLHNLQQLNELIDE